MNTRRLTIAAGAFAAAAALTCGPATATPTPPAPIPVADSGSAAQSFIDGLLRAIRCGSSTTCGTYPTAVADTATGSDATAPLFNELVMSGSGQGVVTGSNAITSGTAQSPALPGVLCSLATMSGLSPQNIFCTGYQNG
ncbi:hypothetical protein [Nocardia sp. NPDC058480]|uniref:hypothetical protein n=1 Tax=Nocardia sp. NPDC058480 TaxID=3346522 RepID=UPI00364D81D4